jgi:hypothetical protein
MFSDCVARSSRAIVRPMALRSDVPLPSLVLDFPHGRITADTGAVERLVALPAAWVGELLECLPDGLDAFADRLVPSVVADAQRVLEDLPGALPEEVAWALSLAFAHRGLGTVAFERWGEALFLVWRSPPASGPGFREFAARFASRVLAELLGLRVRGVVLHGEGGVLRILLASPETCLEVRSLTVEGISPEAILEMLTHGDPT